MANKKYPMDEEQKLEQEALAKIDPEAIKADVISEFGFDEIDDAERIEKAVAKEVKSRTIASKAIATKIKIREELETLKKNPPTPPIPKENHVPLEELEKTLDKKFDERFEKRELDLLEYPDEVKKEIQRVAQIQGVSIKKAMSDPYIQSKTESYDKDRQATEASVSRTHKVGGKIDISDAPPDVDMTTEEGRKEYDKWIDAQRKAHPAVY